jgi:hypothetical protein
MTRETARKRCADRRIAMRDARAQEHGTFDALAESEVTPTVKSSVPTTDKKLRRRSVYTSLSERQKNRFAESLFGRDRERESY